MGLWGLVESPLACPKFRHGSQIIREPSNRTPWIHSYLHYQHPSPLPISYPDRKEKRKGKWRAPIRLTNKKQEGVLRHWSLNNCCSDGDCEAHDSPNRKKLISQTFLKIKIQLFQNSQHHQESSGGICAYIFIRKHNCQPRSTSGTPASASVVLGALVKRSVKASTALPMGSSTRSPLAQE